MGIAALHPSYVLLSLRVLATGWHLGSDHGSGCHRHPAEVAVNFLNFRNFPCRLTQISNIRWPSRPERGALRNVINAGRDAVDAGSALDETCCSGRRSRVVLTPRCWRQVCEKKRRRRCQTSLVTGESTKETVKPLRGECRVISSVTVVTTLVCSFLFCMRGCGRVGRPAFPAPSDFLK